MRIRLERSLQAWCQEAGYTYIGSPDESDLVYVRQSHLIDKLRKYGYSKDVLIAAASFYGQTIEHRLGFASDLRVLCWYWPNGDKIVFPINTHGTVYIGNSPEFWFDCYPFLRKLSTNGWEYECGLDSFCFDEVTREVRKMHPLYIGGQTHFGHFVVDKFAPLLTLGSICKQIEFGSFIVPPGHRGVTAELLLILWQALKESSNSGLECTRQPLATRELPKINGIFSIGPAWVPADNHRPDALVVANNVIHQYARQSLHVRQLQRSSELPSSIAYVSRYPITSKSHDRIANYDLLKKYMLAHRVIHVYPTDLSLVERLDSLSGHNIIISDSGSCCLNAILFGSPASQIFQFQSNRLLNDSSPLATSQIYKSIPVVGGRLNSIIGIATTESSHNTWYDAIEIDPRVLNILKQ
jgi:hypothetical protein